MTIHVEKVACRSLIVPKKAKDFLSDQEILSVIEISQYKWQTARADCRRFEAHRDYTLIQFLFHTGCRIGESCAMNWDAIDRINGVVQVITSKRRVPTVRTIPVSPTLTSILMDFRYEAEKHFREHRGNHVCRIGRPFQLSTDRAAARLKFLMEAARIDSTKCHPHIFRHTYAVRAVLAGMPPMVLARILGHSSVTTTMEYFHLIGTDAMPYIDRIVSLRPVG
jgi:integrase/recombinase XerD